jgi:O-antigen/teichoic acid export membrane protein
MLRYVPGAVAPAVVGLLFTVVFTRLLSSGEYGRYSLALSGATIAASLSSQWLVQGVNRYLPARLGQGERNRLKGSAAMALYGIVLLVVALGGVAWVATRLWATQPWRAVVAPAMVLSVAIALFVPLGSLLQSEMRAGRYSLYQLGLTLGRFLLSVALVLTTVRAATSLLWAGAIATLILIPPLWRDAAVPSVRWVFHRRRRLALGALRLARYGVPMTGWVVAAVLLEAGDRYVIQFARGASEVGIYSANYTLVSGAVALVTAPPLLAAQPFLMRAWGAGNPGEASRWIGIIVEWYVVMGAVLVGGVALFAEDLATLFLGPEFREGYTIIPIVLGGIVVWQLAMYAHKPLEFVGRTRLLFGLGIGVALMNLVLNLLLVPRFGYPAAAYTTLGSYAAYAALTAVAGQRFLRWRVRTGWLLGIVLSVGLGVLTASLVRSAVEARAGWAAGLAASLGIVVLLTAWVMYRSLPVLLARRSGGKA